MELPESASASAALRSEVADMELPEYASASATNSSVENLLKVTVKNKAKIDGASVPPVSAIT